jgi:D-alanyl-D-alanine carboxypeptidase
MTTKHLFCLVFAGSLLTACTQNFDKPKIDSLLNALAAQHQGMGSMVMAQEGHEVYQKYVGIANTRPAGPATPYPIGSITKMFTAVMIFQLIGENKVQLNTPLSTFFPQMPNATKITVKMMLGHRSGLHDFTMDPAYGTYYTTPQTHAQMLARMAAWKPDFEPDNRVAYSNTNFVLLGYIVEKLTGKPYSQALKEQITAKIGLANTFYGEQKNNDVNDAKPFILRKGHWDRTPETDISIPAGAGAIVDTPSDIVKFIDALFNGKLVTPEQLELMKPSLGYLGLGMFKFNFSGHTGYGHTGNIDGVFAELCYFPKEKLAVAYCSNGGAYPRNEVLNGAMRIYFNLPYTIPTFKVTRLNAAKLTPYTGTYISKDTPLKINITADDGVLSVEFPGQQAFPLQPVSTNTFESKMYGATLAFGSAPHMFVFTEGAQSFLYSLER